MHLGYVIKLRQLKTEHLYELLNRYDLHQNKNRSYFPIKVCNKRTNQNAISYTPIEFM